MGKKMEITTMGLYRVWGYSVWSWASGDASNIQIGDSGFMVYDVHWSSLLSGLGSMKLGVLGRGSRRILGLWLGGLEGLRVEGWVALKLLRLHLDGRICA